MSDAEKNLVEKIEKIDAAIMEIVTTGKRYEIDTGSAGGQSLARTAADLAELRALKASYQRELDILRGSGSSGGFGFGV